MCAPFKVNIICLTTNDWWTATAVCILNRINATQWLENYCSIGEEKYYICLKPNRLIISTIDNDKIDAIEMDFFICVWEKIFCVASIHLILWYDPYRIVNLTNRHSIVIVALNGHKCNGHCCSIRLNFTYFNSLCFFVKSKLSIPKRPAFSFLFSLSNIRNWNCQWHE